MAELGTVMVAGLNVHVAETGKLLQLRDAPAVPIHNRAVSLVSVPVRRGGEQPRGCLISCRDSLYLELIKSSMNT